MVDGYGTLQLLDCFPFVKSPRYLSELNVDVKLYHRRKAFWVAKQVLQLGMGDAFDDWLIEKIQLLRKGAVVASGIKRLEQVLNYHVVSENLEKGVAFLLRS